MIRRWLLLPIVVVPFAAMAAYCGLDALSEARSRLAMLEQKIDAGSAPAQRLLRGGAFADRIRAAAVARFGQKLAAAAAAQRLLVERMETLPVESGRPALLMARIAMSGDEAAIVRFAGSLEAGTPTIRFAAWRVGRTAPDEASVRLEAQAVAVWEPVP